MLTKFISRTLYASENLCISVLSKSGLKATCDLKIKIYFRLIEKCISLKTEIIIVGKLPSGNKIIKGIMFRAKLFQFSGNVLFKF